MSATAIGLRPEELARNLFDVVTQFCLAAPRGRRRASGLKELEFLSLSLLRRNEQLIVGDIQRSLGVLPAQMSRVIRSLENRAEPLIICRINPRDKRKIDVALTPAGLLACEEHQNARLRNISDLLGRLSEEELEQLHHLLERAHEILKTPIQ